MHLEGLLHLAALCVAISIAYVGLDRISPSEEDLEKEISKVKESVSDLLVQMEAMPSDDGELDSIYKNMSLLVLYHVAEIKVKKGWRAPFHYINKQRFVPLLNYFRHRKDIKVVSCLAAASIVIFLYITAGSIWEKDFPVSRTFARFSFIWYIGTLVWIFTSVYVSQKLFRIEAVCKNLNREVNKYFDGMAEASMKATSGRKPASPPPDQTPPPTRH